jgi:hypothetical protein
MRLTSLLLGLFGITASLFAQGELFFSTRNPAAGVNAPVLLYAFPGPSTGPGPAYSAGLFLNGSLVPGSLTTFQPPGQGGAAIFDRYVVPLTIQFPGSFPGKVVTFNMRAWATAAGSYAAAAAINGDRYQSGESGSLTVTLGGGGVPPADLPASFTGFMLDFPEPSSFALGLLGILAMAFYRKSRPA